MCNLEITIQGDKSKDEYSDAVDLKNIFKNEIPENVKGKILIVAGATLFGQAVKDIDLVVIGKFEDGNGLELKLSSKLVQRKDNLSITSDKYSKNNIAFKNFCFVIETKRHRAEDIEVKGQNIFVKYKNKKSDATSQSENQKYALKNFFETNLNTSPHITNFIWFKNISKNSLQTLVKNENVENENHNLLPTDVTLKWIFQLACVQKAPFKSEYSNSITYNSFFKNLDFMDQISEKDIFNLFERVKQGIGDLTRKKLETVTRRLIKTQKYAQKIGESLLIISGRAGTGKTIKMLTIAHDLVQLEDARCLILTYNKSLVGDIKRMIALAEISDKSENATIEILSQYKFFYDLIIGLGLSSSIVEKGNKKKIEKFVNENVYNLLIEELLLELQSGDLNKTELIELMSSNVDLLNYDYVLIDEAQDWREEEKEIILSIFSKEKSIIADGIDQMIRSQKKCNWAKGMKLNLDYIKTHEKKSLRQKYQLADFVNKLAYELGLNWDIEKSKDLYGGKVIITNSYNKEKHEKYYKQMRDAQNSAFEMLMLVPPSLVKKNDDERNFIYYDEYDEWSNEYSFWDGTNNNNRSLYPHDVNQFRILQYESCRGLEGWTVVCFDFDQFLKSKFDYYKDEKKEDQLDLESFEEKRARFVNLWALIPLTRAIDTLVITLKDTTTSISNTLIKLAKENPDFIELDID